MEIRIPLDTPEAIKCYESKAQFDEFVDRSMIEINSLKERAESIAALINDKHQEHFTNFLNSVAPHHEELTGLTLDDVNIDTSEEKGYIRIIDKNSYKREQLAEALKKVEGHILDKIIKRDCEECSKK